MGYRRGLSPASASWMTFSLSLLLGGLSGCAMLNSFLDPTKVGRFPLEYQESGVRRILTPRDTPPGIPHAVEPTAEDLVPAYQDYRLLSGDIVAVIIYGLRVPGQPDQLALPVTATGNLRLPELGPIKVAGLTELELEEELKARYREAQILPDPDIQAFVQTRRGRVYTVRGSVGRPGQYPIGYPDTRLLDVVGVIGDIAENVKNLYVIRRAGTGFGPEEAAPFEQGPPPDELILPPPIDDDDFRADFSLSLGLATQEPPPGEPDRPQSDQEELEEVFAPGRPTAPIVFDPTTGEVVQREPESRPAEPEWPVEAVRELPDQEPFDWEDVPEAELEQRVIEIPIKALLAGDARYNIVIRDRDVINVPVDTALFYLMGEVSRPGVYAFNGRDITIKQAIAMCGGLSPLAWPMRCEIIRHEPGTDKQLTIPVNLDAIFAGLEYDVYLRDDDIVNVGTHLVSPFLFVVRNSFRFTYGFGFVYDRNFADKDAYGAQLNPQFRADQQKAQRGLPF